MRRTSWSLVGASLLGGVLVGACGPSADEIKANAAIDRAAHRKKPGYVRLLNLSSSKAMLADKGLPIVSETDSNKASSFASLGAGKHKLTVTVGEKKIPVEATVEESAVSTFVLSADSTVHPLGATEFRSPSSDGNVTVVFDGSPLPQVKVHKDSTDAPLSPDIKVLKLDPGSWSVQGGSLVGDPLNVEDAKAYTIVVVGGKSGAKVLFLSNSPVNKPIATGASAT